MFAMSTGEGQVHKEEWEVKYGGFWPESDVWVFVCVNECWMRNATLILHECIPKNDRVEGSEPF